MAEITSIDPPDLRRETRRAIFEQPSGTFTLLARGETVPVLSVDDISSSGLRVTIERPVGASTQIQLNYQLGDAVFQFDGVTAWESAVREAGGVSAVGINLMSPTFLISLF